MKNHIDSERDDQGDDRNDIANTTFSKLWQEYHHYLLNFILKRVGNAAAAEDILQDVMLRVTEHIDSLTDDKKLEAWLFRITRNVIIDYYRSHREFGELAPNLVEDEIDNSEQTRQEISRCIVPLIKSLPEEYSEALMLSDIDGISQKQVAERQGLSLSGAKSRIQRGRAQLKQKLSQCCQFEFDHQGTMIGWEQKDNDNNAC